MTPKDYNPDVLLCLANLSNDEVFTPPAIVNQMLDLLPETLWQNPNARFLDPSCKTGVFLREIAKRLLKGLATQIPDWQARVDHILTKQLFGLAITELTGLLSRRSVYCSKTANSAYSVCDAFHTEAGNIYFEALHHDWEDGRCRYCGASQSVYDRGDDLEQHAYQFIHTDSPEKIFNNMKFDVIIGNPPYQLEDGGNSASAKPIYHLFIEQAKKLNPQFLCMIIPSRWFAGGKGLDEFRFSMLNDTHIQYIVDFKDASECFPSVNIAGGVCYFLRNKNYSGECVVVNYRKGEKKTLKRALNEYPIFVRDNVAISILQKLKIAKEDTFDKYVLSRNAFSLTSNIRGAKKWQNTDDLRMLSSEGFSYIKETDIIDKAKVKDKFKVIVTYAMSGGNKPSSDGKYQILSSLLVLLPKEVCTETFLVVETCNDEATAQNVRKYLSTKFVRFLLLQALSSIHITKSSFVFVPYLDFSKPWTDEELYKKYNLTQQEIDFIESMIRPME